ncbi:hypothetical protein C7S18_09780 [Ahniella affigens]|uniref:Uncharacterized protein n=1 Tax=Ahniella affigens TaxID=2021234 RepID=A0A2P1PRK9_9GAMM|nr:hypothetical protein C7S18_09780 [Ahniella affigens]
MLASTCHLSSQPPVHLPTIVLAVDARNACISPDANGSSTGSWLASLIVKRQLGSQPLALVVAIDRAHSAITSGAAPGGKR